MVRFALVLSLVLLLGLPCLAEEEAPKPAKAGLITLQMKDAELRDVLSAIATQAKANVIMSPKVSGKVSVDFRERPWLEALKDAAEQLGFRAVEKAYGIVRVVPRDELEIAQDYYRLRHRGKKAPRGVPSGDPAAAEPAFVKGLRDLVRHDGAGLRYIPQENTLIFSGTRSTLKAIKLLLMAIDRRPVSEAPPPDGAKRRYEELLRDAKTETAAKYFEDRLLELRGIRRTRHK